MMKKFFETALNDQLKTMGEPCKIVDKINQTVTPEFMAVVTTKTGDLTAEIGSMTYNIDGHALIPESVGQDKIIGNRLVTKEGEYIITSSVKSKYEVAFSCDLVKVRSI
jgi:hypothetical protein